MEKEKVSKSQKIFTIIGIVLCVILIPILVVNLTFIVKSFTNKDEVPDFAGMLPLIVLTDSMSPVIDSGDLIICSTVEAEDVKEKDIISFFDPAGNGTSIVTHRVIEVIEADGQRMFRTKGDFNNTEDKDLVPGDKLVGTYKMRIPGAGHVAMFMQSTAGLIVCVVLPILLIVGYDIIRRRMYEKNKKDDTAALMAELEALRAMQNAQKEEVAAELETVKEEAVETVEETVEAVEAENEEKSENDSEVK